MGVVFFAKKKTCLSVRVCSVTTRFARATFTCSVNQAKPRQREATFFNAKKKKKREVTLKAAAAAVTERTARDCSTLFRHSPSKAAELEKTFFLFECLIRCFCCVCVGSFGGGGFLPGNWCRFSSSSSSYPTGCYADGNQVFQQRAKKGKNKHTSSPRGSLYLSHPSLRTRPLRHFFFFFPSSSSRLLTSSQPTDWLQGS